MAASVTVQRFFEIPGCGESNGLLNVDPSLIHRSSVFEAGGYYWSFYFYSTAYYKMESVGIFLRLETPGTTATVLVECGLVDPSGSRPVWKLWDASEMRYDFDSNDAKRSILGTTMEKSYLENKALGPGFFTRGGLLFHLTFTIFSQPKVVVPPSDMTQQLARIRVTGKGADVTFAVQGAYFKAHKAILAARSPVFEACLYGGMTESRADLIEVQDMDTNVFNALLDYIYTDSLPTDKDYGQSDEYVTEMLSGLLVAADRYCLERLKILCEDELCKALDVKNVSEILELANDQNCSMLKEACIEFMVTAKRIDKVKETEGYTKLRNTRPGILLEVFERSSVV